MTPKYPRKPAGMSVEDFKARETGRRNASTEKYQDKPCSKCGEGRRMDKRFWCHKCHSLCVTGRQSKRRAEKKAEKQKAKLVAWSGSTGKEQPCGVCHESSLAIELKPYTLQGYTDLLCGGCIAAVEVLTDKLLMARVKDFFAIIRDSK